MLVQARRFSVSRPVSLLHQERWIGSCVFSKIKCEINFSGEGQCQKNPFG